MVELSASSRNLNLDQLRAILEYSPVPTSILQWNKILYTNPAGIALLGSEEAEQTIYRSILRLSDLPSCGPDHREESQRKRLEVLRDNGDRVSFERRQWIRRDGKWRRQDGGTIVVNVRAWAVPLAGGDGTQITFTDVTVERQQEQTQEQRDLHLRLAIDSAEVGIWDFDPVAGTVRWSPRCREIFEVSWKDEVDYRIFLKMIHPEDRARVDRALQESLSPAGSGDFGCDYRILCPDGGVRWIAAKAHAFFSNLESRRNATRLIGTVLDITDLRQSDASLRQNEKLAVTGRLAASIAHEINNPLEAITNLLYLLDEGPLQNEQRKYIQLAQQELARVVDISTQALRFYRDPSAPAPCHIGQVVDSAMALFNGRVAAMQIQIEREDSKNATVLGAREELRQMLVNLIHNAMDAMPHGGRLLIRTHCSTNWQADRNGVRIVVADTGHGMNAETRKRIFEPFFTTRAAVGTGLGLWLCAEIVQKHGGSIRVKSRQKANRSGSVFSVFLPFDRRK